LLWRPGKLYIVGDVNSECGVMLLYAVQQSYCEEDRNPGLGTESSLFFSRSPLVNWGNPSLELEFGAILVIVSDSLSN